MHQYTADLANRAAAGRFQTSPRVTVVTTTTLPRDRYNPAVEIQAPVTTHCTGFSRAGLDIASYRRVLAGVLEAVSSQSPITGSQPSGGPRAAPVHFTGVHLWNVPLVYALRRRGIPVIHTLHDPHPHAGYALVASSAFGTGSSSPPAATFSFTASATAPNSWPPACRPAASRTPHSCMAFSAAPPRGPRNTPSSGRHKAKTPPSIFSSSVASRPTKASKPCWPHGRN